jgi:uncharacterized membrane protein YvbJ
MKYNDYESDYIKCPECGTLVDKDSLLCRKCGHDCEQELRNGRSKRTQVRSTSKQKHYKDFQ